MERLTFPKNLTPQQAVQEVIKNNKKQKYNPQRFINMMSANNSEELLSIIENLILSSDEKVLGNLLNHVFERKYILTIEDFVAAFGKTWGINSEVINRAIERIKLLDECAGEKRFEIYKA